MADLAALKKEVGIEAAKMIQDGMRVGLGTGSTAAHMIDHLAQRIKTEGIQVHCVSTSWSTTLQCRELGIPLLNLTDTDQLDIAIDGADEIDAAKNLIKGRGAAHLLEKIVAAMADTYVIIADQSKKVAQLGAAFPVPLEVHASAYSLVCKKVYKLGATEITVRMGAPGKDGPVISDSGNLILDARFPNIANPAEVSIALDSIPGLLGHGIFAGMTHKVILATDSGLQTY